MTTLETLQKVLNNLPKKQFGDDSPGESRLHFIDYGYKLAIRDCQIMVEKLMKEI